MPSNIYNNFKEALLMATTPEHRKEIMELKFGCKCRNIEFDYEFIITGRENPEADYNINEDRLLCYIIKNLVNGSPEGVDNYETISNPKITEIIGRPIVIDDVLRACDRCNYFEKLKLDFPSLNCGSDGKLFITGFNTDEELQFINLPSEKEVYWHLGLPAHLQLEETLITLTKLLINQPL